MRKLRGKKIIGIIFWVVVICLWVYACTRSVETFGMFVDYNDHYVYKIVDGQKVRAYPDKEHDPETCPICIERRKMLELHRASADYDFENLSQ